MKQLIEEPPLLFQKKNLERIGVHDGICDRSMRMIVMMMMMMLLLITKMMMMMMMMMMVMIMMMITSR